MFPPYLEYRVLSTSASGSYYFRNPLWRVFLCVWMMDIIYINDLRIDTTIGVYAWEQAITQKLSIDIEIAANFSAAADSDDIADTLNYAALAASLEQFIGSQKFKLLETLAQATANFIQQQFNPAWLRLKINKSGAVPNARQVGVIIERNFSKQEK